LIVEARDVVKWREVVPSERGEKTQIVLGIETQKAKVYGAYDVLA
jgi:hypothetical protein